jgi:hypothetical protein
MKVENKICFKCKKIIEEDSHYFAFHEINKKELIRIDYCHKFCWDGIKGDLNIQEETKTIISGMKNWLTKQGVIPEQKEEYIIS